MATQPIDRQRAKHKLTTMPRGQVGPTVQQRQTLLDYEAWIIERNWMRRMLHIAGINQNNITWR